MLWRIRGNHLLWFTGRRLGMTVCIGVAQRSLQWPLHDLRGSCPLQRRCLFPAGHCCQQVGDRRSLQQIRGRYENVGGLFSGHGATRTDTRGLKKHFLLIFHPRFESAIWPESMIGVTLNLNLRFTLTVAYQNYSRPLTISGLVSFLTIGTREGPFVPDSSAMSNASLPKVLQ